jgi:hypothetical protein
VKKLLTWLLLRLLLVVFLAGCAPAVAPTPQVVKEIHLVKETVVASATTSPVATETVTPVKVVAAVPTPTSAPAPGNPPNGFSGPGMGGGQMMGRGMTSSGHAPGGLVAVSPDGKPLPTDPNNKLPENTAAQKIGNLNVTLALSPYPPASFQNGNFDITLTDDKGQAVTDAQISLDLTMPGMWMPPSKPVAQNVGNGKYHATAFWTMRDMWQIEVIIQRGGAKQSAFFDVWL